MQKNNVSRFNFEQCQKCSICVSVCPMKEVNPLYPGPKQAGPDGERYRMKSPEFFDYALKYCLNCKRCEVACPSGVKVADLIAAAKLKYGKSARPLRDRALANTDFVGSLAVPFSPIVNHVLRMRPVAKAMDAVIGIDSRRHFPSYAGETFSNWFRHKAPPQDGFIRSVSFFHGCYVEYNNPELGRDFVKVMNACGYGVRLLDREKCCGVALLSNGLKAQAASQAAVNISSMKKALREGSEAVLTTSSSCTFTMREEYPGLLEVDNTPVIVSLLMATRFLFERIESGEIRLAFKEGMKKKIAYHIACHIQRMGWEPYSINLLKMIPGLELTVLPQECCGIAGTFGFKKENYEFSQRIGSKLFKLISDSGCESVACDCETCKWQIEMSTGLNVYNPIEILSSSLDIEKTSALNTQSRKK